MNLFLYKYRGFKSLRIHSHTPTTIYICSYLPTSDHIYPEDTILTKIPWGVYPAEVYVAAL